MKNAEYIYPLNTHIKLCRLQISTGKMPKQLSTVIQELVVHIKLFSRTSSYIGVRSAFCEIL